MIINDPLDMHVHLRQDEMLKLVAPLTAKYFSGCLVMPNINPPINDEERLYKYRREIISAMEYPMIPYMTLYFSTEYSKEFLSSFDRRDLIAIKFYPKGLTTNSQHGCDPKDKNIYKVLEIMEELQIPLSVHAEAPGYHENRELLFHHYLIDWGMTFPKLKIIIEHISNARTIGFVNNYPNIFGTITAHHLLITGDDVEGNTFLHCAPIPKTESDRLKLLRAVIESDKIMFGSDSAPHQMYQKQSGHYPKGVFTAPIALQLLAEVIEDQNIMQEFVSDRAKRIYNLTYVPKKTIELVKEPFIIPNDYGALFLYAVPMWAGKTLKHSIKVV